MLYVPRPLPSTLILKVRIDKLSCPAESAAVREVESRRIRSKPLERLAQSCHDVEVEDRIAVWLGTRQFPRKRTIRIHLIGYKNILVAPVYRFARGIVACQPGKLGSLQGPAEGVVVRGITLLHSPLAVRKPVQITGEPTLHLRAVLRTQHPRHQKACSSRHLDQM